MNDKLITWEEAVRWLRNQPEQKQLVQYCYYDDPVLSAAERFSTSEEWYALRTLMKSCIPGKVLDLGAGRGISSYAFAKVGCSVVALEPDSSQLVGSGAIESLTKQSKLPIEIVQEYGESLPFKDETFDLVYGRAVLHHAQDLSKLCKEVERVLKPGGAFIATREHVISRKEDLPAFLDGHALHFLYGGENAYLLDEYKQSITQAGLSLKKTIGPMDSVINYAPTTLEDFTMSLKSVVQRRLGEPLASWLSAKKIVQQIYGRYLSRKSQQPGRHFSFLAFKK